MTKKAIVFFSLALVFVVLTSFFLGLTAYFTGVSLYALYGPHRDAGTVVGGLFCFLTIFPFSIFTVVSAGGVFPFTSLFRKMNGKDTAYNKAFFVFAVIAILVSALCIVVVPIIGAVKSSIENAASSM